MRIRYKCTKFMFVGVTMVVWKIKKVLWQPINLWKPQYNIIKNLIIFSDQKQYRFLH